MLCSYHLPGQELASLVGLSLWNLRLVRGFELETPPAVLPRQAKRVYQVDERVPEHWPRDPVVSHVLAELDWIALLAQHEGWVWDAASGELRCPEGRRMVLTTIRSAAHTNGTTVAIFRRPTVGCEDCSTRSECLPSQRKLIGKHFELAIPTSAAERLRERLCSIWTTPLEPATSIQPILDLPGPFAVHDTLFLPAEARHTFTAMFGGATLRIEATLAAPPPPRPRLVAADVADRQRRRKIWQQNLERYAAPVGSTVRVEVAGSPALRRMLGELERVVPATRYAS